MSEPIHVISLGAGVQSSTMALMAACGEITPMPASAIFADTQDEPASVYTWLDWLESQLPFPVYRVTAGKLSDAATRIRLSKKSGNTYIATALPAYTVGDGNGNKGIALRHCTKNFKIDPIRRHLNSLRNKGNVVLWIGISVDEAHRMKPSRDKWGEHVWPLIDKQMSRQDCLRWMRSHGFPTPPRSACSYCPFHSDKEWLRLKTDEPEEFSKAVAFEQRLQFAYREATAITSTPYLHNSRVPLADVVFDAVSNQQSLFGNECEGMCGV